LVAGDGYQDSDPDCRHHGHGTRRVLKDDGEWSLAADYWVAFWRRRWRILVVIFAIIGIAVLALTVRTLSNRPFVAQSQMFVSIVPVSGASEPTGSSFESESRQAAIDLSQVVTSRQMAATVSGQLPQFHLTPSDVQNDISGSADNRVVTITVASSTQTESVDMSNAVIDQLTHDKPRYLGSFESSRTLVTVISAPTVSRTGLRHILLNLIIRLILAALVALGVALAIEYFEFGPRIDPEPLPVRGSS
jgi:capsular polysaccharide biosynthesis protein